MTREQSLANIRDSLAAEAEFTPENQRLRRASTEGLLSLVGDPGSQEQLSALEEQIAAGGDAQQSELLTESIAEARRQLALGGELDVETRNEIARQSIARGGNTGKARFLVPRDLGITSLQLQQQRLEQGGRFGQIEQGRSQESFNNLSRLRQLREQLAQGRQGRAVQLAGFGQSLQAPQVGLDPGEFAGLFIQNQNISAQAAAQRAQNRATNATNFGQAISAGAGAIAQVPVFRRTSSETAAWTPAMGGRPQDDIYNYRGG